MEPPEQFPSTQPPEFSGRSDEPSDPSSPGHRPPFRLWVTVLYGVALIVLLIGAYVDTMLNPMSTLTDAPAFLQKIASRELDGGEYVRVAPAGYRSFLTFLGTGRDEPLQTSIRTFEQYLSTTESAAIRVSLMIMLGEAGRFEDLRKQIARFGEYGWSSPLIATLRWTYLDGEQPLLLTDDPGERFGIELEWARDKLFATQARKLGQESTVAMIDARIVARGRTIHHRAATLTALMLAVTLAGLVAFGTWYLSGQPDVTLGEAQEIGSWDLASGVGVLLRGVVYSLCVILPLALLLIVPLAVAWSYLIGTMLLVWLVQKHLLHPVGMSFVESFGLKLLPGSGKRLVWVSIAVMGVELFGCLVLSLIFTHLGMQQSWVEAIPQELLLESWTSVLLFSLGAVLFAPFIEEVTCRGVLFLSLRTRFGLQWAALLTAVVFSVLHLYSFGGFVQLLWVSFVWTLAFARTRSLLPCIIGHATGNFFLTLHVILTYRM